jgi:CP family cyanate transporter-like MFS transporter
VIRARTPDSAAQLAAMAQSVGYVIASIGPFVLGLVSKWPDPRFASAVWLAALALATVIAGLAAGRPRFVDDRRALRDPLAATSTP